MLFSQICTFPAAGEAVAELAGRVAEPAVDVDARAESRPLPASAVFRSAVSFARSRAMLRGATCLAGGGCAGGKKFQGLPRR